MKYILKLIGRGIKNIFKIVLLESCIYLNTFHNLFEIMILQDVKNWTI